MQFIYIVRNNKLHKVVERNDVKQIEFLSLADKSIKRELSKRKKLFQYVNISIETEE